MGHSSIRIKVRRRKVANLAARSRQFSVRNCTIPTANKEDIIDIKYNWGIVKGTKGGGWNIPKEGYPQYKPMMKAHMEMVYNKETHKTDKVWVKSTFPDPHKHENKLWKNLGMAAKMEAYTQEKLKKWDRKHPKPCPNDDLFKDEMIPAWEAEREQALIRIRDFVVSMFDKLPLTGRYKKGEHKFDEKLVAEIKDVNGDGHKVNELDDSSKLLNKAKEITNKEKKKNKNLVATNLRDHTRKKGRIILPECKAA